MYVRRGNTDSFTNPKRFWFWDWSKPTGILAECGKNYLFYFEVIRVEANAWLLNQQFADEGRTVINPSCTIRTGASSAIIWKLNTERDSYSSDGNPGISLAPLLNQHSTRVTKHQWLVECLILTLCHWRGICYAACMLQHIRYNNSFMHTAQTYFWWFL